MAKPKPSRVAGARLPDEDRDENAPPAQKVITMVRDKPASSSGPTSIDIDEDDEEKYVAGGWRRATVKEAAAVEKKEGDDE